MPMDKNEEPVSLVENKQNYMAKDEEEGRSLVFQYLILIPRITKSQ